MNKLLNGKSFWIAIGAVVTMVAYLPVLRSGFLNYDDPDYVTANPHLFNGFSLDFVKWAFTGIHSCNWHPLTWFSHLLDLQLFWFNPAGHHLTSLLFHVANFILLTTLLWRSTGIFYPSLLVGLLFAVHPLHVESVAWVAERKDVLSAFFWFVSIHVYVSFALRKRKSNYFFALVSFSLAIMAKPMAVTLPLVLLLMDYWPLKRLDFPLSPSLRPVLLEKVPFFLIAAASSVVTYHVQERCGAVITASGTFPVNAGNAIMSYSLYLVKTIWPAQLAFIYPFRADFVTLPRVGLSLLVLGLISWFAAKNGRTRPHLIAGWLWYLVTLIPVIGFIRVGDQAMADRYTYLPLIGIFIAVVWEGWMVVGQNQQWKRRAGVVTIGLLILLALLTWKQCGYWKNGIRLNRHAVEVTGENWAAHYNLGAELNAAGDAEGAIAHYLEAARLFPEHAQTYYNLGKIHLSMDKPNEAVRYFLLALARNRRFPEARLNLGWAYLRTGRPDLAIVQYRLLLEDDERMAAALLDSIRVATAGKALPGKGN